MVGTLSEQLNDSIGTGRVPNWRDSRAVPIYKQVTPATVNATATMTAADILTGIVTSTSAAAVAATLPLVSDLEVALQSAVPGLELDDCFDFAIVNTGPSIITMTTNTGWTLVGDMTVAPLTAGDESSGIFRARRVSASAYTLYRLT